MPRKNQFTFDDVVEAAFELVRENGWRGFSVSAVAQKIGCSTMPIYSHFKNLEKLGDEVLKKAWRLMFEYNRKHYTGDAWIDQGIGYVRFAQEERRLFLCLYDGRNRKLQREMILEHWEQLTALIDEYEGFQGLDNMQKESMRYARAMFCHGVAATVALGWFAIRGDEIDIARYLAVTSEALLRGYKDIFAENGNPFVD